MAFKFKTIRTENHFPNMNKPDIATADEEVLSGYFDGIPANRGEEFFMQEADRMENVRSVEFRMTLGAPKGLPGWLELDALIETYNGFRAFEIDDMSFVHLGQREAAETKVKDSRRIDGLRRMAISVREIEHVDAAELGTRADAAEVLRSLRL